jgi:hypothetical protein
MTTLHGSNMTKFHSRKYFEEPSMAITLPTSVVLVGLKESQQARKLQTQSANSSGQHL